MLTASKSEVTKTLRRMLANGPLNALPTRPRDLDVLLALAAARFEPRRTYSEAEVNDLLEKWLATFASPFGVDHVTVRRCMVDSRLLERDKAGSAYRVARIPKLAAAEPAQVLREVQRERAARKRKARTKQ